MPDQEKTPEEIQRDRDEQDANNMALPAEVRHTAHARRQ
jgi:hypothetical protein